MWLTKRVKAGVMLYALLMVAVFSLLLQFYLNRQVSLARTHKAGEQALVAYSIAYLTKEKLESQLDQIKTASPEQASQPPSDKLEKPEPSAVGQPSSPLPQMDEGQEEEKAEAQDRSAQAKPDASKDKETVKLADRGEFGYNEGRSSYQLEGQLLTVEVELRTGKTFRYTFHIDSEIP